MDLENKATGKEPVVITADSSAKSSFKLPNPKLFLSVFALLVLVGGVGAGVYLAQKPQDITPQASEPEIPSHPVTAPVSSPATQSASLPQLPPLPPISTESALIASKSALPVASTSSDASPSGALTLGQGYDFNGDASVNSVDLSVMYSGWGTPTTDTQKVADINHDGVINGIDYALFLPHFRP